MRFSSSASRTKSCIYRIDEQTHFIYREVYACSGGGGAEQPAANVNTRQWQQAAAAEWQIKAQRYTRAVERERDTNTANKD